MLKNIDNSNFEVEHIIVVPDRFSLQAEKLVFEMTGRECVFNVSVLGLTALASKFLSKQQMEKVASAAETLLLCEKAMSNVKDQLLSFKKNNINFVHEVQKAISQFQSCGINPDEFDCKNKLISSKNKFHDLSIIYREYLSLLGESLDSSKLLQVFCEEMPTFELGNFNFYFVGFDSFTNEVERLIKGLIKHSQSVNIAAVRSVNFGNDYIYEKDVIQKMAAIAEECGVIVDTIEDNSGFTPAQQAILNNLFSSSITPISENNFYYSLSANGKHEEVLAVAKIIKSRIIKGDKFRDFAIACSNLDKYTHAIERVFDELEIPFYIDKSLTCDQTMLAGVIFKFFDVVLSGYSKENLLGLVSCQLLPFDDRQELTSIIEKFNISGKAKYKKYLEGKFDKVGIILEKIEKASTATDFCCSVSEILTICEDGFVQMQEYAEQEGLLREKNINAQAKEIILEACQTILQFESEVCLKEFQKKFKLVLSFKEVMSVPAFVDAVFVGDATASAFGENENLFVLGCENLPTTIGDSGLISDDDIESAEIGKRIEPSIRMLNRRNRFKLFCLLLSAKSKLFTSYLTTNEEGRKNERPLFVDNLVSIFNCLEISASRFGDLSTHEKDIFLTALGGKKLALRSLARFYRSGKIDNGYVAALARLLQCDYQKFELERNHFAGDSDAIFFPRGYTKVTQLESYFSCPFKHFVRYGLKLKENDVAEFDGRDIGNLCHKMAEIFVKKYKNNIKILPKEEVNKFVNQNFDFVLKEEKLLDKFEVVVDNKALKRYLTSQAQLLLSRILYELASSHFEVFDVEHTIDNLTLDYKGEKLKLVGKVDRIDIAGDYFRIIDYKTGYVGGIIKDLYYGDKLQLFLYEKAISKKLGKKSAGAFYFDAKWNYQTSDEDGSILKGVLASDEQSLDLFDKNIETKGKSDIVGIALSIAKVPKSSTKKYKGFSIAKNPLTMLESYASAVGSLALEEIGNGYISPKPDEKACESCKYLGICQHCQGKGYRKKSRVKEDDVCVKDDDGLN